METAIIEGTHTPKQQYFARDTGQEERQRLLGLQREHDPMTIRSLRAAGLARGKRCLEVGAGAGSIARLMGEESGIPAVAVDMDPRFLDPADPHYEIRKVDITAEGALDGGRFDLVHCRALLMHMPDPAAVIARLCDLVAPGGALVVEEPDASTFKPLDMGVPGVATLQRVVDVALDALAQAGSWHNTLGLELPGMLGRAGLSGISSEGVSRIAPDDFESWRYESTKLLVPHGVATGRITQAEADEALLLLERRAVRYRTITMWSHVAFK